jgi:hypothetical protein
MIIRHVICQVARVLYRISFALVVADKTTIY